MGRFAPVIGYGLLVIGFLLPTNNQQPTTNNLSNFARRSAATAELSMDDGKEAA